MIEHEKITLVTFPRFPILTLGLTILLTLGTLVWLVFSNYYSYYALDSLNNKTVKALELSGEITYLDEVLTMSAKMAAATGEKQWETRYNTYDPILTNVINDALLLIPPESLSVSVKKTDLANAKLVEMEHEVFRLVNAGNLPEAKKVIFSPTYDAYKKEYKEGMDNYNQLLHNKIEADLSTANKIQKYSIIISFLDFLALIFTWIITYRNIIQWKETLEQKIQSESRKIIKERIPRL